MKIRKYSYIYALYFGKYNTTFYIGQTVNPISRLSEHRNIKKRKTNGSLLKSYIKKRQLVPQMRILAKCKFKNANRLEKAYITKYKNLGYDLKNQRAGGESFRNISNKNYNYSWKESAEASKKAIILKNKKTGREYRFNSVISGAKFLKTSNTWLSEVLTKKPRKYSIKGYYARYSYETFVEPNYLLMKPIVRISIRTGSLKIYPYMSAVQKDGFSDGAVWDILKNYKQRRKQHKGYDWMYL